MDGNGRRWTRWMAAVLGASAFFALAGIAAARLSSESSSTTIAPQQNGTVTAKCSSGSTAVAGGFAAPGLDPTADTGPAILTYASARPADGKWQASGHNFNRPAPPPAKGVPGAGPLVAYAYCDKHDPSVSVRGDSTTVDGGGHASLEPTCPHGSEAVSGGFQSDTPGTDGLTDYAYASKRVGDQAWKIAVLNPDMSSHKVRAFAYCEKRPPNLVSQSASKKVSLGTTPTISAKCPKGSKAFSGGYQSTLAQSGTEIDTSLAFTSKRSSGQSWKVSAIAVSINGPAAPPTEKAIVYCAT
ncbi:MAG: hypothetical protein ACM3O7_09595 [Acidobacteriota bacterium]